jgi:ABC-2 type transport system permease protein/ribosome-dependent ATPase
MGIRQRLALACALVHGPLVLFLDEPTSGVDPIGRRRFWKILVHLARVELVAILLTTHYMSEAEHCDHLALMHAGKVIADDTPAALKTALGQEAGQVLDLAAEPVLSALEALEQAGISILNILILWLMVIWLFGAPFKGDPLFFFLASTIYVTCTTGIGLLVSLLVRTQVAAMMMTVVVTVVPSVLYSGLLVPIASMDPAGQFEAHLFPAMYYTDIILGSFLKGVGMEQLWGKVLALLIYAIVLWTASFLMFHKRPKS